MQLPHVVGQARASPGSRRPTSAPSAYPFLTDGQRQPAARPRHAGADRHLRPADARGPCSARWRCPSRRRARRWPTSPPAPNRQDDGTYRLIGTKMWISGGDHELTENIVHLVLAKIPGGPPGVKGISLFIVPKFLVDDDGSLGERNDVVLAGLNHKMGYRGTDEHAAQLRRGRAHARRAGRRGRLPGRRAAPRPDLHVPHDERGPDRRRRWARRRSATPATCTSLDYARTRTQGRPAGREGPVRAAGADHRARRRAPDAAGAEVLRRGRAGARPVLRAARRRGAAPPRPRTTRDARAPAARHAHADREELALAVVPGRPTTSPSRCTAATATPATTTSSSSTATTGSTRSTRARTASRRSTCSAARSCMADGAGLAALGGRRAAHGRARRSRQAARRRDLGADAGRRAHPARRRHRHASTAPTGDPAARAGQRVASTWRRPGTSWSRGCGWSRSSPPATATTPFHDGKRQAARYFFRFELPKTGPQLDLLARLDRTTYETDPGWL